MKRIITTSIIALVASACTRANGLLIESSRAKWETLGLPTGIGAPSLDALDISQDGSVVVGVVNATSIGNQPFRWTRASGIQFLSPGFKGLAYAVSADGNWVAGESYPADGSIRGFRWSAGTGPVDLGMADPSSNPNSTYCGARDMSADGSAIVGSSKGAPFVWDSRNGMTSLTGPSGWVNGIAMAVTPDARFICGASSEVNRGSTATRWDRLTPLSLGDFPGGETFSIGRAISADGRVVVGQSYAGVGRRAFRWTAQTGMVDLGFLPGRESAEYNALAVTDDGNTILGTTWAGTFLWTSQRGMRLLEDVLRDDFDLNVSTFSWHANGMSRDGRYIYGGMGPVYSASNEAFVLQIPEPASLGAFLICLVSASRQRRR